VIVIVPHMVLERILDHAGSYIDKEVIGVLLGRTVDNIIEITNIVPYPEASYPERAVLPANFLYNTIGDEMRERGYQINVKGYYRSHPPDVFPLTFSQIDFTQYEELQNIFARKQPFLAIIVNPVSRKYVFLTLDVGKREISLDHFTYHNLTWIDYAVSQFSDGFSPYRVDPQTGEGVLHPEFKNFLDRLSQKYEQKKIVTIMLDNATKYREILEKLDGKLAGIEELKEAFSKAKTHYYNEDYVKADTLLEAFIKTYTEQVADKIEPLEEMAALEEKEYSVKPGDYAEKITFINGLLHAYFGEYYEGTTETLNDEINEVLILEYVKRGYTIRGLFFENLQLAIDNLKEIFKDNFQNILSEIEKFIKNRIQEDIGTENLEDLTVSLKNMRKCPYLSCRKDIEGDAQFCPHCGRKIVLCSCDRFNKEESRFCVRCGRLLRIEEYIKDYLEKEDSISFEDLMEEHLDEDEAKQAIKDFFDKCISVNEEILGFSFEIEDFCIYKVKKTCEEKILELLPVHGAISVEDLENCTSEDVVEFYERYVDKKQELGYEIELIDDMIIKK